MINIIQLREDFDEDLTEDMEISSEYAHGGRCSVERNTTAGIKSPPGSLPELGMTTMTTLRAEMTLRRHGEPKFRTRLRFAFVFLW